MANYRDVITIEPGKRGGRPCVRGLRIAVADVLGWLAAGMSEAEILADFPELTEVDVRACVAHALLHTPDAPRVLPSSRR